MDRSTARQVVLVSMVVSGGVIAYDLVSHKEKLPAGGAFKAVWATGVLFLLLAMLSDTVPDLAAPFAGVTTLAIVIGRGGTVRKIVNVGSAAPAPHGSQQHPASQQQNTTTPKQGGSQT